MCNANRPRQKLVKIMFLNCHCIREEKVLLVIVKIIYGLFCVHFILIRLDRGLVPMPV